MRQYTTPEQTTKLIELGFEKPKGWYVDGVTNNINLYVNIDEKPMMFNYSIGELIEMLSNDDVATTRFEYDGFYWYVDWDSLDHMRQTSGVELIDELYDMCVQLKEKGVI
jgi:hypothetical protein